MVHTVNKFNSHPLPVSQLWQHILVKVTFATLASNLTEIFGKIVSQN